VEQFFLNYLLFCVKYDILCGGEVIIMRVKMIIQYLGTNYSGWQIQPNQDTIQQRIQDAIRQVTNEDVEVHSSGRTDAGVHANKQVAHFDTYTRIDATKLAYAINAHLPKDIRILQTSEVKDDFHSRFDVVQKTYHYYFYASEVDLPLLSTTNAKVRTDFDYSKARSCISAFLGEHDFCGFCSAYTQASTTVRTIFDIKLDSLGDNRYRLSVTGNGFLYNMVRIIAGTIIDVGCGKIDGTRMVEITQSKDRNRAGRTASA